jgi:hypothetical protein
MKLTQFTGIALALMLFSSCATSKTVKFSEQEDNIYKSSALETFLSNNSSPNVLLRVGETAYNLPEETTTNGLFHVISNKLAASGFVVRDQQLFSEVISNDQNNTDYNKIRESSKTDLIIELTKLDTQVLYRTNKYIDQKDNVQINEYGEFEQFGASVAFKIILVKTNEVAGIFEFNYAPCTEGCLVSQNKAAQRNSEKIIKERRKQGYEIVETNLLEDFMRRVTTDLMTTLKLK